MVDPVTAAFAGAAIVQLIGVWKAERGSDALDIVEFKTWLIDHKFNKLADELSANSGLSKQISGQLDKMNDQLCEKLDEIKSLLIGDGDVKPSGGLNTSLCMALVKMIDEKWEYISLQKSLSSRKLCGGNGENLEVFDEDWRAMETDLETLSLNGYLREDWRSDSHTRYGYTREVEELVNTQIREALKVAAKESGDNE